MPHVTALHSLREFSQSLSFLRKSKERSSELEQRIINAVKLFSAKDAAAANEQIYLDLITGLVYWSTCE
ncbi:hypothetical protein BRADI_2g43744v3 [Brachypodium distachyon]|uniref:Uncharacterized protein n=1 Tax=Brachypodium distachyon TaxID=15368 RepID=A0A0Q3GBL1_BRADI|nr:hypothetical protein BRADI_2g43744v3 [Brachypodium distachyon]